MVSRASQGQEQCSAGQVLILATGLSNCACAMMAAKVRWA